MLTLRESKKIITPYPSLMLGVIKQAVEDARGGALDALLWLEGLDCADFIQTLGGDSNAIRRLVLREGERIMIKAAHKQFNSHEYEPRKPMLVLVSSPAVDRRMLVLGVFHTDDPVQMIDPADLQVYGRQFDLAIFQIGEKQ